MAGERIENMDDVAPCRFCLAVVDYREFACGWAAAMVNITVTFPVNKLIFRQMLHGIDVRNAFLQMVGEGFTSLYRGVLPPLLQKSVSSSIMFGTYDMFKNSLPESNRPRLRNCAAALLAGTVETTLTPFERIQTLLQDSAYQKKFTNMKHAVREVGALYGVKEYYRGFTPILLRNGPSTAVFFALKEEFSSSGHSSTTSLRSVVVVKEFLVGACIGALNSAIFHPFNVIKVHMQSQLGGSFVPVWKAARELYVERGRRVSKFYTGVHMNYTRSFIGWGVINLAYERFKVIFRVDKGTASR